MKLYAIGDTHLSFAPGVEKPMDVFGPEWENHWQKLYDNWTAKITDDDYVIVNGDLSWGLGIEEAKYDLDWLRKLPGTKIFFKGNHDLWWTSHRVLDLLYGEETEIDNGCGHMTKTIIKDPRMNFIHNDCYVAGDYAICGTRGWTCPGAALPSITGIAAYGPMLPRPRTALPSETTAMVLDLIVYL